MLQKNESVKTKKMNCETEGAHLRKPVPNAREETKTLWAKSWSVSFQGFHTNVPCRQCLVQQTEKVSNV